VQDGSDYILDLWGGGLAAGSSYSGVHGFTAVGSGTVSVTVVIAVCN